MSKYSASFIFLLFKLAQIILPLTYSKKNQNTERCLNQMSTQIYILFSDHQNITNKFCAKYHGKIFRISEGIEKHSQNGPKSDSKCSQGKGNMPQMTVGCFFLTE